MKSGITFLIVSLSSYGDCLQYTKGVVVDKETQTLLDSAAIGKYTVETIDQPSSRRSYSDQLGEFEISKTSGGFRNCPDLELYFSRSGYQTRKVVFESHPSRDTGNTLKKLNK